MEDFERLQHEREKARLLEDARKKKEEALRAEYDAESARRAAVGGEGGEPMPSWAQFRAAREAAEKQRRLEAWERRRQPW